MASTSLVFMLDEVPDPVWKTSTGNWSSQRPSTTSAAASWMAAATSGSSTFSSAFTLAAAALILARASMWARSKRWPETGKFSTARCVWARHLASAGTLTSPIESCSMRKFPPLAGVRSPACDSSISFNLLKKLSTCLVLSIPKTPTGQ